VFVWASLQNSVPNADAFKRHEMLTGMGTQSSGESGKADNELIALQGLDPVEGLQDSLTFTVTLSPPARVS
jgi:hypothetical protein